MMMKRLFLLLFVLVFAPFFTHALDIDTSFTYQPFVFGKEFTNFGADGKYEIEWDKGRQFIYQGGLKFRSGFNLGFGLKYDSGYDINNNVVGIFSDILGYAGFRRFSVRVSRLTMPGTITMLGVPAEGQEKARKFEDTRTQVELLYTILSSEYDREMDMYAGIKYTYMETAVVGYFDGSNGDYHLEDTGGAYGIVFGVDSTPYCLKYGKGFGVSVWGNLWASFAMGRAERKTLDGNYVDLSPFILDCHTEMTLGFMILGGNKIRFGLGVGYMGELGMGYLYHGLSTQLAIKI